MENWVRMKSFQKPGRAILCHDNAINCSSSLAESIYYLLSDSHKTIFAWDAIMREEQLLMSNRLVVLFLLCSRHQPLTSPLDLKP